MEWNHIVPGLKEAMVSAVNNNDWSAVRRLIENTAPKDSAEYTQLQQIHVPSNIIKQACSRGFTELTSVFLNNGFPVDYIVHRNKQTMLHLAAKDGHLSLVKLLLIYGANIDKMSENGNSPLHKAVSRNHLTVAEHLISAGADLNTRSKYGDTLLQAAPRSIDVTTEKFQLLSDSGCNPNVQCDPFPPLCLAVEHNNVKMVQMLLDAGAHVNGTEIYIPLHVAALRSHIPIMELLLKYGADVNARDRHGDTALHKAVLARKLHSVKFLIEHGSKINTVRCNRETPLLSSISNAQFDITMLLINNGALVDLDIHDKMLHKAVYDGAPPELLECLLERGARVTTVYYEATALYFVIFCSKYSTDWKLHVAKLLLIYGSDHYIEDRCGNTILHWACEMGDVELVEYLIHYGLNVDAKNREGKKPYDIATENGYTNIVTAIIHYLCNKYTSFN